MDSSATFGAMPKASHLLGGQQGHFGDLLGGRLDDQMGVDEEQRAGRR